MPEREEKGTEEISDTIITANLPTLMSNYRFRKFREHQAGVMPERKTNNPWNKDKNHTWLLRNHASKWHGVKYFKCQEEKIHQPEFCTQQNDSSRWKEK